MDKILGQMEHLNFFAGLSVVAATILTVMFFKWYAGKKLPPTDGSENSAPVEELNNYWYLGLFCAELFDRVGMAESLSMLESTLATSINLVINVAIFFGCYGILSVAGVDKENLYARCQKAFMGLVILLFALLLAFDYFVDIPDASNKNVPAVTQQVQAEYVTTLNGENIFIDLNTLVRTNNAHEDAAPEFKCVLIDTAEVRTNCEFTLRRGVILMYIDGVEVGNSIENPEIEELYNAIVQEFL